MENLITQENKERLFINILKGLAVFFMIWGHCVQYCIPHGVDFFENTVFKFIYSFHMPLFMLISGYLFYASLEKREFKEIISHRVSTLLYIAVAGGIFIWMLTTMIYRLIFGGGYSILIDGKWLSSITDLWFVWSVLTSTLVVSFVYKKVKNVYLRILCLIVGALFVFIFPNADLNLYMYPYFLLGYFYAKYRAKFNNVVFKVLKYLTIPVFIILLFIFKKKHYIYLSGILCKTYGVWGCIDLNLFRWIIGLVGCIAVISISKLIFDVFIKNKREMPPKIAFAKLGEKSLQMYVLQSIIVSFWLKLFYSLFIIIVPSVDVFFARNIIIYNLVFTVILAIVMSFITYFFNKSLDRLRISYIIFKR